MRTYSSFKSIPNCCVFYDINCGEYTNQPSRESYAFLSQEISRVSRLPLSVINVGVAQYISFNCIEHTDINSHVRSAIVRGVDFLRFVENQFAGSVDSSDNKTHSYLYTNLNTGDYTAMVFLVV